MLSFIEGYRTGGSDFLCSLTSDGFFSGFSIVSLVYFVFVSSFFSLLIYYCLDRSRYFCLCFSFSLALSLSLSLSLSFCLSLLSFERSFDLRLSRSRDLLVLRSLLLRLFFDLSRLSLDFLFDFYRDFLLFLSLSLFFFSRLLRFLPRSLLLDLESFFFFLLDLSELYESSSEELLLYVACFFYFFSCPNSPPIGAIIIWDKGGNPGGILGLIGLNGILLKSSGRSIKSENSYPSDWGINVRPSPAFSINLNWFSLFFCILTLLSH